MKEILLSKKVWLASVAIALAYVVLAVYLMNFSLSERNNYRWFSGGSQIPAFDSSAWRHVDGND